MRHEVVVRTLQRLARAANRAHQRAGVCAAKAVECAARSGEALRKARDLCDTEEWADFLENDFQGSLRTAQRYMYLAKHWPQLQAAVPRAALTSQRKAVQVLNALLLGDEPLVEGAGARPKKPTTGDTMALSAPTTSEDESHRPDQPPTTNNADDDERRIAIRRMYDQTMRVLTELADDLSHVTPRHYNVSHALSAIHRARDQCQEAGQTLFPLLNASPQAKT